MVTYNGIGTSFKNQGFSWSEIVDKTIAKISFPDETIQKDFRAWMLTKEKIGDGNRLFDPKTYYYCYKVAKKLMNKDIDHITAVVGFPGVGKSTLGFQIASVVSPTFSRVHMVSSFEEFCNALDNAKPCDTIVIDEAVQMLFSRMGMQQGNKQTISLFMQIRQLRIHLVLCIPEFKHLDTYVRENRVNTCIYFESKGLYRVIMHKGVRIINEVYPKLKNYLLAVRMPTDYWFHGNNNKIFPVINDITREWYLEKKRDDLFKTIDEMRAKVRVKGGQEGSGSKGKRRGAGADERTSLDEGMGEVNLGVVRGFKDELSYYGINPK